jgi:hypothetical protein
VIDSNFQLTGEQPNGFSDNSRSHDLQEACAFNSGIAQRASWVVNQRVLSSSPARGATHFMSGSLYAEKTWPSDRVHRICEADRNDINPRALSAWLSSATRADPRGLCRHTRCKRRLLWNDARPSLKECKSSSAASAEQSNQGEVTDNGSYRSEPWRDRSVTSLSEQCVIHE